jgi:tRNA-Thr(GGU) m(6)t(6)A37 methyltransferase TsaA
MTGLVPIGVVHSPYKHPSEAPHQNGGKISKIVIHETYAPGLKDIEGFSHLIVLYHLHLSRGFELQITTPWDTRLHGLFTTRSPRRPNPVGFQVVELVEMHGSTLHVRGLDAIEGTPVLDIKPYLPATDARPNARAGWLAGKIEETPREE